MQRSTVKASYARNRHGTSWGAHGVYLAREGAQREDSKGLGFDDERDNVDLAGTLRAWQAAGDERLWKFVVSPEHAASLDLREHARELVGHMQRDLGSRLEWVAIDHHNTDNPHVHLLVRGRDLDGRALRIPRDYLTSGLRHRSQELATQRLGLRSDREMLAARSQATERTQFTELDHALLRRADAHGIVSYREPVPRPGPRRELYTHELRRLQFLETAGLAEKSGARSWRLLLGMETALRQAEYWRLQREAAARGATISKCTADCLREYFALRTELATAIETPGQPGEPHHGAIIHSLLARSEERLVATLGRRTAELLGELRRAPSMLDRLVLMYLIHTPEVPQELRAGAIASANRRYANYQRAVTERFADNAGAGPKDTEKNITN